MEGEILEVTTNIVSKGTTYGVEVLVVDIMDGNMIIIFFDLLGSRNLVMKVLV